MNILINNVDFWDGFDAAKYWTIPKSHSKEQAKEEVKTCILSGNYIGSIKRDGIWCMIIKDTEGNYHLRTRTKNVKGTFEDKISWVPHIEKELSNIPNGTVLLGELYFPNNEGSRKVTSVFNCLKNKCLERQEKNGYLHYYVFDVLAYKNKILINEPIITRIEHYLDYELIDVLTGDYIERANYIEGQELFDMLGKALSSGLEGIVIQKKTALYLCGKRKAWDSIKCKKELQDTIDAFIDGALKCPTWEYTGKDIESWQYWANVKTGEKLPIGMHYAEYVNGFAIEPITRLAYFNYAAAISFSVMDGDKPVHIGWISGIPDSLRSAIVENPDSVIGDVYELTAMEIESVTGGYTLRHGKIVQKRTDGKTPADCEFSQITN